MLRKSIKFFIAGILTTFFGGLFAGLIMGVDEERDLLPLELVSLFSILFSVALYYLSKIEQREPLRIFCIVVSVVYTLSLFGTFLPDTIPLIKLGFIWSKFLLETVMLLLAANVLLGKTKKT